MLVGKNFHHNHKSYLALKPKSVTNTTHEGETISEPWKIGHLLTFLFLGGAFAATVDGAIVIQGLKRSDGTTWEALKDKDGNNLVVTPTKLDDGGALENGIIVGSIPTEDIDSGTYMAVRAHYTESGNAAALVAGAAIITGLRDVPSGDTDDLLSKVHAS